MLRALALLVLTSGGLSAQLLTWDSAPSNRFGATSRIDGSIAVSGGLSQELGVNQNVVLVFREDAAGDWAHTQTLEHPTGQVGTSFGLFDGTLDLDSGWLVVTDVREGEPDQGAAYAFEDVGGALVFRQRIAPDTSVQTFAGYGSWVAIDGSTLAIGAPDDGVQQQGAVLVYSRVGTQWNLVQRLEGDPTSGADFGGALRLDGDLLAVTDQGHASGPRVEVFQDVGGVWTPLHVLPDPLGTATVFGHQLDLDGDRLAVLGSFVPGGGIGASDLHVYQLRGTPAVLEFSQRLNTSSFGGTWMVGLDDDRVVCFDGLSFNDPPLAFEYDGVGWVSMGAPPSDLGPGSGASAPESIDFRDGRLALSYARATTATLSGLAVDTQGVLGVTDLLGGSWTALRETSTAPELSVSAGGTLPLFGYMVGPGTGNLLGELYLVLASASGTAPGFSYGGFTIPLNPDSYTVDSILFPNSPSLTSSFGTIGFFGEPTLGAFGFPPTLTLAAGSDPALIGLEGSFAVVALDATNPTRMLAVTNAIDFCLVP